MPIILSPLYPETTSSSEYIEFGVQLVGDPHDRQGLPSAHVLLRAGNKG